MSHYKMPEEVRENLQLLLDDPQNDRARESLLTWLATTKPDADISHDRLAYAWGRPPQIREAFRRSAEVDANRINDDHGASGSATPV